RRQHSLELGIALRAPGPDREVRVHASRADAGRAYTPFPELVVERSCEAELPELRRVVDRLAGKGSETRDAREGKEVPLARLDQVGQRRGGGVERSLQVDVDHGLDLIRIELEEGAVGADPGVGDRDVQVAETLDDRASGLIHGSAIADVAGHP